MLQIAANWIEQEIVDIAAAKEAHLAENCAAPDLSGDQAALMVKTHKSNFALSLTETMNQSSCFFSRRQDICKKLYQSLDKIDEDRYDSEAKVAKTDKEVHGCCDVKILIAVS